MANMDSLSGVGYITAGVNNFVLPENDTNKTDIFPEGVSILQLPDQNLKASRKKKRPPREDFQTFERIYTLSEEYLGSGSYSHVFTCKRKTTGEKYAAKIVDKNNAIPREKILNEVELHHLCRKENNILSLVQFFEENSRYIFVYPLMKGGSLLRHIERKTIFTESEAREVVKDVSTALCFLHKHGVAHRDLKPDNILCDNEETITPVKICDFDLASGIGSWTKPVSTPVLQTPVGSAEYMAPEVVKAFVNEDEATYYDKRCDLWSLGVILYIMLSGHPPFYGNCDEDCGWDRNETCNECHNMLWNSIQDGRYSLSGTEWSRVSSKAKDLITHLLVRDASRRYSADTVLHCAWITQEDTKDEPSGTPVQSPRVNFDVSSFLDEANKASRTLAEHANLASKSDKTSLIGLSPPGNSSLAKRRACKSKIKS
ncbi:MAP kinase-interacting serine/threonine-protein kinase 1-like [Dendronephthya gigantea]|uniref:MAP kinase-interacting serine/threonine-protein kinase 1-like n=1 Tax=Dendronephthya gigantea TaxID=151771 RepID=UPI00106A6D29|nr:MAP kinase-interacting serine/threonine-protein kinase 1-like [Dendronephthya gigantea]XP_028403729.1 MAP kinase-interacting serine/threonine-protein kinase 1-like [Dendronephthya gigantea]